jgi:small subunit ribosomal protein S27e
MPGSFVSVACPECDNEQTLFTKVATTVSCVECGATLATPTGGEAAIEGAVREVVESR